MVMPVLQDQQDIFQEKSHLYHKPGFSIIAALITAAKCPGSQAAGSSAYTYLSGCCTFTGAAASLDLAARSVKKGRTTLAE
jgi:hypothetical protein